MNEDQVIEKIHEGLLAQDLLKEADPNLGRRFKRLCKGLVSLICDVKKHFPDAQYYTASGGLHLLLAPPHHSDTDMPQQEVIAVSAPDGLRISDGSF